MKTAILLGAGASKSEGAPLQHELFREYFKSESFRNSFAEMDRELATFFLMMFGIDVDHADPERTLFPTFEEALGLLDLAERRRESFPDFSLENIACNSNRIGFMRQYLVLLMARVIHDKLGHAQRYHSELVRSLANNGQVNDTFFISTNYDILIDNALAALGSDQTIDYGVEFTNYRTADGWQRPEAGAVRLYKLHGSLNWLLCPTCNTLTLTPREKGVIRLLTDFARAKCQRCETVLVPVIVPPTYFKDTSNLFLSIVWHKADLALAEVDHLVVCGYSFPDADIPLEAGAAEWPWSACCNCL